MVNQPTDIQAFATYVNQDFATIKGFDFTLKLRRVNHLAGEIAYTLAFAKGTGSMSTANRNIAWQSSESVVPPKQTIPLDFDQRHKFSITADYRYENNEGPEWGNIQPFENAGINVVLSAGSGLPYTPMAPYNEVTLASTSAVPTGPINSNNMPWTFSIDTKISKSFKFTNTSLNLYLWIENLLDRKNPVRVFESSGSSETTTWLTTDNGVNFVENQPTEELKEDVKTLYEQAEKSPLFWANPRTIRFGVVYSF